MKYKTIGAFKNVQNVPYCKAASDLRVGMGVILDRAAKTATAPGTVALAKTVTHIVTNINDKPEIHTSEDSFAVPAGDFVRADDLRTVIGLEAEFYKNELTGGDASVIAVGDALVFDAGGKLAKIADATGYAIYFKVIKKTDYFGGGLLVEILEN